MAHTDSPASTPATSGVRPADDTRDLALDAAAKLFREQGYDRTSVKQIAAAVGISAPALYWHFASKGELLYSVLDRILNIFWQQLSSAVEQADSQPVARLDAFVKAYVTMQLGEREQADTFTQLFDVGHMMNSLSDSQREQLLSIPRGSTSLLRGILADGVADGTFRITNLTVATFAILTMCENAHSWFRPEGGLSVDEIADAYAELARSMTRCAD